MPSKGIDCYSYIAPTGYEGTYTVQFTVPGRAISHTPASNFTSSHLEVDYENIPGMTNYTGRFEWRVLKDGDVEIASAYNDINTLTGNLKGGNMMQTALQESMIKDDVIVNYGFYDAGHGEAGLPNHNQCYVTVISKTRHATWMSQLAPPGSEAAQKPFSRFVLAAPHDDGMNSMQSCEAVLQGRGENVVAELTKHLPWLAWFTDHLSSHAVAHMLPNLIYSVSITQKDTIPTLLALGARYFEYRPAHLLPIFEEVAKLPKKPHFQHACIPGLAFDEFLDDTVTFLDTNISEHAVIHIRWDNIVKECKRPTQDEIEAMLDEACSKAQNQPLKWGRMDCFDKSIDSLRASGTRIIMVVEADKYDSWTAEAYATLTADSIIGRFESMNTEGQNNSDITVLQCQATSQSIKEVLVYSVMASNADTSCLTATKAKLDTQTLPWIRDNALDRLKAEKLVVIMNDFLDGATTDVMIDLNRKRLNAP